MPLNSTRATARRRWRAPCGEAPSMRLGGYPGVAPWEVNNWSLRALRTARTCSSRTLPRAVVSMSDEEVLTLGAVHRALAGTVFPSHACGASVLLLQVALPAGEDGSQMNEQFAMLGYNEIPSLPAFSLGDSYGAPTRTDALISSETEASPTPYVQQMKSRRVHFNLDNVTVHEVADFREDLEQHGWFDDALNDLSLLLGEESVGCAQFSHLSAEYDPHGW
eukprot:TRINITY_DN39473_c0_g1_i1.p1 TRINITY_DN39473_c0_g1~~TRINITY_DN39473_c0_g1_i1.p1  ORF type:complete len:221 (-),score=39.04 TRINITY_DN39473_c0_g1_i1:2-664(-)